MSTPRMSAFTVTRSTQQAPDSAPVEHWIHLGECRDADPSIFEPDNDHTPADDEWSHARTICDACPVRELCLEDALTTEPRGLRYGMRGGKTPAERQSIYRARVLGTTAATKPACGDKRGTDAGFQRHKRASQQPCKPCRDAHNEARKHYGADRELRILELLAQGTPTIQIARTLHVGRATVYRVAQRNQEATA